MQDMKNPLIAFMNVVLTVYLLYSAVFLDEIWQVCFSLAGSSAALWVALIFAQRKDELVEDEENDS